MTLSGQIQVTSDPNAFQKETRGLTIYVFDPNAPASSVQLLPIPYNKMTCGPRPLPPATAKKEDASAGASGGASGAAPKPRLPPTPTSLPPKSPHPGVAPEVVLPTADAVAWLPNAETSHPLPSASETQHLPSAGSGKATTGGKEKSPFEKLAQEVAFADAIANGQMNEDVKRADGQPYGIPTGKNATGPNNPVVQFFAGATMVGVAVLSAGADGFRKKLVHALKDGKAIPYGDMAKIGTNVAEEIAEKLGPQASVIGGAGAVRTMMAEALQKSGTIGPYKVMKQFTDDLGARWQAHHILEVKMFKKFELGNPELGPSVLLTQAEHKEMTKRLAAAMTEVRTTKQLWQKYQEVYADHPDWLKAIEAYFQKAD